MLIIFTRIHLLAIVFSEGKSCPARKKDSKFRRTVFKRNTRAANNAFSSRIVASSQFYSRLFMRHALLYRCCPTRRKSQRVDRSPHVAAAVAAALVSSSLSWVADWPATRRPPRRAGWCSRELAARVIALCGPQPPASTRVPYQTCPRASKLWSSDVSSRERNYHFIDRCNAVESSESTRV